MTENPEPGWYHADGDAPGTQRYWTGTAWQGGPQPVGSSAGAQPSDVRRDAWDDHAYSGRGRNYGEVWPRFAARFLDGIILAVPMFVLTVVIVSSDDFNVTSLANGGSTIGLTLLSLIIGAAYEIGFVGSSGATPGKMALGLKVISENGDSPPGFGVAAVRWVVALVSLIPILGGLIGLGIAVASGVMISSDDSNRSVYDRVAKTYVVKK